MSSTTILLKKEGFDAFFIDVYADFLWELFMGLLIAVIYLIFISLGLPDSLLGSGWPKMQTVFEVPSSFAGYVSMTISFMTIISALLGPKIIKRFHTKWIVIFSIVFTELAP